MTGPRTLDTARHRTAARMNRHADLRAVIVEGTPDAPERVVVAFASDEDAQAWAQAHLTDGWRVVPAQLAAPR